MLSNVVDASIMSSVFSTSGNGTVFVVSGLECAAERGQGKAFLSVCI